MRMIGKRLLVSFKVTDHGRVGLHAQNLAEMVKQHLQDPVSMDLVPCLLVESWAVV